MKWLEKLVKALFYLLKECSFFVYFAFVNQLTRLFLLKVLLSYGYAIRSKKTLVCLH
jgi:hypothetical protein